MRSIDLALMATKYSSLGWQAAEKIQNVKRNINFRDALNMVEDLNLLHEWGASDGDGGAGLKVSHKHPKTEYENNYHETSDGPDATLKDYPTEAVSAFERGVVRARAR